MASTPRRVAPERQPVRTAIALVIIALLTALMTVVGVALAFFIVGAGFLEDGLGGQDAQLGQDLALRILVITLVGLLLIAVTLGMQLATVILAIIVVVKGDGKLRLGASLLLAVALFGMFFSVSLDVPTGSGAFGDVVSLLATVLQVVQWGVSVAGIVIVWLGIREVRRARAGHPRGLR